MCYCYQLESSPSYTIQVSDAAAVGGDGSDRGSDGARTAFQTRKLINEFQHAVCSTERAPFPVIVALHGHVIGLGVDLIGACDIRYAASNSSFAIKVRRLLIQRFDHTNFTDLLIFIAGS